MQTITINVRESHIDSVISLLQDLKNGTIESYFIAPQTDKNLENDPYFYERKARLTQLREDVKSKKMPMYDFESSMDALIKELEA